MKRIVVLLVFFSPVTTFFGHAQHKNIDSLINVVSVREDDTTKVKLLNSICRKLWTTGEYDKSMTFANEALDLAEKLQYKRGVANTYNNIGVIYDKENNYSKSLTYHFASLKSAEEAGDKQDIMYSYGNIANVYSQQGKYIEALENYAEGLAIAKQIGNKQTIAYCYSNIGFLHTQQGNYAEALKNHLAALQIEEQTKDKFGMANSYRNIGHVYFQQGAYNDALKNYNASLKHAMDIGDKASTAYAYASIGSVFTARSDYKEALKQFQLSLKIEQEVGDKQGMAEVYDNIGSVYTQINNLPVALDNYLLAMKIEEEIGNKKGTASTYINLGALYIKLKQVNEAEKYLNKGLQLARDIGVKNEIKDSYEGLSRLDSLKGNFEGAYKYYMLYSLMEDSLLNEKSEKEISELKIQYETDKKDQQIGTQNLQLQNQTLKNTVLQTRIYYGVAVSLLVTIIIVLLLYLRARRRKKEYNNSLVSLELTALKAQLNPHFIFNALNSIKSYIDSNPKTGSDYLTRFSLLMRGVLEGSEEKEISLGEEMQLMQHYLELESLRLTYGLKYSITYDPSLNKEDIMIPPLITQPVIENAVWHGLAPLDEKGELTIHNYLSEGTLFIIVANTSTNEEMPVPAKLHEGRSFGMKITKERLLLLRQTNGKEGSLSLERSKGKTTVAISIPLRKKYKKA